LRVTLSHLTKDEHLEAFLTALPEAVQQARTLRGF
jgi:cysteine sulfinate desulfinase/cysteine desulfurase-like protein